MNEEFINNVKSLGKVGDDWLNSIPGLIKKYEKLWSFETLDPFKLSYNYVAPVELKDSGSAVLKIGLPGDTEFMSEINALTIFNGGRCIRVLKTSTEDRVALLEKVSPGKPLSELEDDVETTKILVSVIKGLHKPVPANTKFVTVEEWAKAIPKYLKEYGSNGPLPKDLVQKAINLFQYLIASSKEPVLLHGDLHHDNVLFSDDRGWIAIDPKGIVAEPTYEVAAMIRNPYKKLEETKDLATLLKSRINILSEVLDLDKNRITQWCFAQTMLSAVWSVDGTNAHEHALRVACELEKLC